MEAEKLLPVSKATCPFCGSPSFSYCAGADSAVWLSCDQCLADGPLAQSDDDAIRLWNTRHLPDNGLRDALEEAEIGLAAVIRLSEMGFEESMLEPEEHGNYAGFNLAKSALETVRQALSQAPR